MIIFLDIDGVLNPFGFNRDSEWDDAEEHIIEGFSLLLSRELGGRLASLPATIIWATTWQEDAWRIGEIVDINADHLELGPGWKQAAILSFLQDTPSPFVWIDDDEVDDWSSRTLEGNFPNIPKLLISPDPSVGITKREFEEIKSFVLDNQNTTE